MAPLDLVQAGEAVHVGHADVEQDEVRLLSADQRKNLCPRLGLPDDLEVVVRLERALDPVQDEPVVVRDHDPHGSQCRTGRGRPFWNTHRGSAGAPSRGTGVFIRAATQTPETRDCGTPNVGIP